MRKTIHRQARETTCSQVPTFFELPGGIIPAGVRFGGPEGPKGPEGRRL